MTGSLDNVLGLTHLGKVSPIETDPDKVKFDLIHKPLKYINYVCRFSIPEFQSLCPVTGQPDYATIIIDYVPDQLLIESKALKLWMFAFRNHGAFHEAVTAMIADRLAKEMKPYWIRVASFFNARGGISIDTVVEMGHIPSHPNKPIPLSLDHIRPYHSRGA